MYIATRWERGHPKDQAKNSEVSYNNKRTASSTPQHKGQNKKTNNRQDIKRAKVIPTNPCPVCGGQHWKADCPQHGQVRNQVVCYQCNQPGHIKRNCPQLRQQIEVQQPAVNQRPGNGGRGGGREGAGGRVQEHVRLNAIVLPDGGPANAN